MEVQTCRPTNRWLLRGNQRVVHHHLLPPRPVGQGFHRPALWAGPLRSQNPALTPHPPSCHRCRRFLEDRRTCRLAAGQKEETAPPRRCASATRWEVAEEAAPQPVERRAPQGELKEEGNANPESARDGCHHPVVWQSKWAWVSRCRDERSGAQRPPASSIDELLHQLKGSHLAGLEPALWGARANPADRSPGYVHVCQLLVGRHLSEPLLGGGTHHFLG